MLSLICDYCDQPATHILRPEWGSEPLCKPCARSQTDGPLSDYVFPLTARKIERLMAERAA